MLAQDVSALARKIARERTGPSSIGLRPPPDSRNILKLNLSRQNRFDVIMGTEHHRVLGPKRVAYNALSSPFRRLEPLAHVVRPNHRDSGTILESQEPFPNTYLKLKNLPEQEIL